MQFTAKDVQELRMKTGCGMMDCKKALTEKSGNMQEAVDYLREKGLAAANKKSGKIAAEGLAVAYTNADKTVGAIVEINSETDFVAKNSEFQDFVKLCADCIIEKNPADIEEMLKIHSEVKNLSVEQLLQEKILTLGENIKIRRFKRFEGIVATYIHAGGKISVMVKFEVEAPEEFKKNKVFENNEFNDFTKDIAMQVAASSPLYLDKGSVPEDIAEHEKKILREQIINDGKPENVVEKIVNGRIDKFYKDVCLTEQVFVKDSSKSISQYVDEVNKKLNLGIKIVDFVRFEKGQGLQKREENFADEVANLVK
ncbi:elongation factor Ts [Clostridia bacterium]|nr:elongation factor Ts [Clostridia bacterium]